LRGVSKDGLGALVAILRDAAKTPLLRMRVVSVCLVIPGRASSARTRNPEQCTVLDSGSAAKRAHPGMTSDGPENGIAAFRKGRIPVGG
jgi:hypothetical protein